jgi:hypothetical protein
MSMLWHSFYFSCANHTLGHRQLLVLATSNNMKKILLLLLITSIRLLANGQVIRPQELFDGKWKYRDLPDSIRWADSSLHICPYNPTFWFKDSRHVDVVWNGFYFKDQAYRISKTRRLLFVYIDSPYENVGGFSCVFKPVKSRHMKMQYHSAQKSRDIPWNDKETSNNTNDVYLFNSRPR